MCLSDPWANKNCKENQKIVLVEIRKPKTYKCLCNEAKEVLRGKFIALSIYIRKLNFHLKKQKKNSKLNSKHAEGRK